MRLAGLAIGLALVVAACEAVPSTTDPFPITSDPAGPSEPSTLPPTVATAPSGLRVPAQLQEFPVATVVLAGERLVVAVADTDPRRQQGLMEVDDLHDLDAMLFVYDEEVTRSFVMRNTAMPLDVAFFDEAGELLGVVAMVPCRAEPCPIYLFPLPFRWALEAPPGFFSELEPGDRLEAGTS